MGLTVAGGPGIAGGRNDRGVACARATERELRA